jgi:thiol-disulfide isomerase/thioredoxin
MILLCIGCISCQKKNNVQISVELEGYKSSTPVLYGLIECPRVEKTSDTVVVDNKGRFSLELSIDKPQLFGYFCRQDKGFFYSTLLIKPNEEYTITSRLTSDINDKKASVIKGSNSDGQALFSSIDNGHRGISIYGDYWTVTNPESLIDSLNNKIERAIKPFINLAKAKKIDEVFFNFSESSVRYYYAFQLATIINAALENDSLLDSKLKKINSYIFETYPLNDEKILYNLSFIDYVELYISHVKRNNFKEFKTFQDKKLVQTYELSIVKKVLTRQAYKYFAILYLWSLSNTMEKETIDLFEEFKEEYPNYTENSYYKDIENELIPSIRDFYKLSDKPLQEGINILDDKERINSFSNFTSHFKGKYIFIDCWATWCGGCIYQFQFNKPLKDFLNKNGIEMAYIAFEHTPNREKWKNYIKKHNLKGAHFMLNDSFQNDLYKKLHHDKSFGFSLPRYILVDKDGTVMNDSTLFPNNKEKLYEQIKSYLK